MGVPTSMLPHTVVNVRAAASTDAYNNATRDYGVAATRTDMAGWLQQSTRDEPRTDGRDADVQTWLLITNEAGILQADRFEWAGPNGALVFEVDGPPEPVYTPAGYHHTEATLRVVTG